MSETSIARVQEIYARFGQGDIAGLLNLLDDAVVWHEPEHRGVPYAGLWRGKEELLKCLAALGSVRLSEFRLDQFFAQDNRVVVLGGWSGTTPSGGSFTSDWAAVWTFGPSGQVTEYRAYENLEPVAIAFGG